MPALPSPGPVVKAALQFTLGSSTNNLVILHYRYSGGRPQAIDLNSMATTFGVAYSTALLALWPAQWSAVGAICTDMQGNDGLQGSATFSKIGTGVAAAPPASACCLQNFHINARYRGGHPRAYWPGMMVQAMTDSQHWATTSMSTYNTEISKVCVAPVGQSFGTFVCGNQCVVSYYTNKALRPTPLVLDVQSRTMGNNIVGTQRRRLRN